MSFDKEELPTVIAQMAMFIVKIDGTPAVENLKDRHCYGLTFIWRGKDRSYIVIFGMQEVYKQAVKRLEEFGIENKLHNIGHKETP